MTTPWINPLPLRLRADDDPLSFLTCDDGETILPIGAHPGAFGVSRKHHTHEGVDLYAPEGTFVKTVEQGVVVRIEDFTGPKAGTPWWRDTQAVFVEGLSGVVVYGEICVDAGIVEGKQLTAGSQLGHVIPVLTQDKGRPACMLHLELHDKGAREAPAWDQDKGRPTTLRDPTPYLIPLTFRTSD